MFERMGQMMMRAAAAAILAFAFNAGSADASINVVTHNTRVLVSDNAENPIEGVRVDLLRDNGSNTGIRTHTGSDGIAGFEILPGVNVKFKIYYNGATYVTGLVPCGETVAWHLQVASGTVGIALKDSNSNPIEGARVDLLRGNGSNTGVRGYTDAAGEVEFDALPGSEHKLKVYHNGGAHVTGLAPHNALVQVTTASSHVFLTDSGSAPIAGQRVNLLRSNGSNTGVRVDTDANGFAAFEILPGYTHKFKVYHNGGSYITAGVTYGDDVTVQTQSSVLTFLDDEDDPHVGARINLLRDNGSNTGVRVNTDSNGEAAFEILPGYVHRFLIYFNGGTQKTTSRTYGEDLTVATVESELEFSDSDDEELAGYRVNLLRANGSNTGVKVNTDEDGEAVFQVLDDFEHRFRVYFNGGTHVTDVVTGESETEVETVVSKLTLKDSGANKINGARVDLLRENGSNTGVKVNTVNGVAAFEVFEDFAHKFKVHYNGGTQVSAGVLTGDEDEVVITQFSLLTVTLNGVPAEGARVDLLRENNSNTGKRTTTDILGIAGFEVLPTFVHNYRVRLGSEWVGTESPVTGGEGAVINHVTTATKLALTKAAAGDPDWAEDYAFGLDQNYPNPFNPSTTIRYTLAGESDVRLVVYNTLGQQVKVLIEARQGAGRHAVAWDGRDAFGREVATGMYVYRLIAGENESMKKMTFSK